MTGRLPNTSDPEVGFVQLDLIERATTEPKQSGYWLLKDESLRGHVTGARIRHATDGRLLLELEREAGVEPVTYQGQLEPYNGVVPFAELYTLAQTNQLAIIVRTDVAGRDSSRALLRVVDDSPWGQPHCS